MGEETLNLGLAIAMEWGKDWLNPIQTRLKKQRPDLSPKQLRECNKLCQDVMRHGHKLVHEFLGPDFDTDSAFKPWAAKMRETYPWISDDNLGSCFSQGYYYASK